MAQPAFKRFGILSEEDGFDHEIDDMAKAATPPFLAEELKSLPDGVHCSVVVWRVVQRKVPDFLVWDLVRLQYFDDLVSDIGPKVANCQFRDPKDKLAGIAIPVSKKACNTIQRVLIPRPPTVERDMYHARCTSQYVDYLPLVFLKLGNRALANGIVADVGVGACNKWAEVLENGSQPPILGFSEGQVALDNPFDDQTLEDILIEALDKAIRDCLISGGG